jgi:hypothetical protein
MFDRRGGTALCIVGLSLALTAGSTLAQAEPEISGAAVREGWVAVSGSGPAFSLQLPPGWSQGAAGPDDLAVATSEAGAFLALSTDDVTTDTDLDAHVTSVEKRLEKQRKGNVPTVFRMTPAGLVARLELAPGKRQQATEHSALFIFPACEDGTRTLTISGLPPAATEGGAPDEWDLIAGAVNPCSADPTPEPVVDGLTAELAAAYHAFATETNARTDPLVRRLQQGGSVSRWTRTAGAFASVYEERLPLLMALPWTPETRSLSDAMAGAYTGLIDLFGGRLAKARNARTINRSFDEIDEAFAALTAAGRAIRLAVGLPSVSR